MTNKSWRLILISHLNGVITKISENEVTIDVNGVGYKAICSSRVTSVSRLQEEMFLFTELIIREMGWSLYAFLSEFERNWFNLLISVQGVGGKVAIAILSALTDEMLTSAFSSENKKLLCSADGVGDKLAARIVSELKPKVDKLYPYTEAIAIASVDGGLKHDVLSALINLGYNRQDILSTLSVLDIGEHSKFDEIFKLALRKLSGYKK